MSSTNRGSSYKDKTITDYYVTPISEILKFFAAVVEEESDIFSGSVVDPAAGGDPAHPASYPEALSEIGIPESMVSTIDIREDSRAAIKGKSYLEMELAEKPNLIITNPPFIIAQEFIEKALKDVRDGGYVVMLLRLNFFGSSRRKKLWEKSMPKKPCP